MLSIHLSGSFVDSGASGTLYVFAHHYISACSTGVCYAMDLRSKFLNLFLLLLIGNWVLYKASHPLYRGFVGICGVFSYFLDLMSGFGFVGERYKARMAGFDSRSSKCGL